MQLPCQQWRDIGAPERSGDTDTPEFSTFQAERPNSADRVLDPVNMFVPTLPEESKAGRGSGFEVGGQSRWMSTCGLNNLEMCDDVVLFITHASRREKSR